LAAAAGSVTPKIQEPVCGIPHHTFSNAATACRKKFYPREACYGAMWRYDVMATTASLRKAFGPSNHSVDKKIY
jgi:hypothetical protein